MNSKHADNWCGGGKEEDMGTGLRGQHLGQAVQVDLYQADAVMSPIIHTTILKKRFIKLSNSWPPETEKANELTQTTWWGGPR